MSKTGILEDSETEIEKHKTGIEKLGRETTEREKLEIVAKTRGIEKPETEIVIGNESETRTEKLKSEKKMSREIS